MSWQTNWVIQRETYLRSEIFYLTVRAFAAIYLWPASNTLTLRRPIISKQKKRKEKKRIVKANKATRHDWQFTRYNLYLILFIFSFIFCLCIDSESRVPQRKKCRSETETKTEIQTGLQPVQWTVNLSVNHLQVGAYNAQPGAGSCLGIIRNRLRSSTCQSIQLLGHTQNSASSRG